MMRGTPASSQIIWLEDKVKEQADEIERLREECSLLRERDRHHINDYIIVTENLDEEIERLREALKLERQLRDDALRAFNEARAALKEGE